VAGPAVEIRRYKTIVLLLLSVDIRASSILSEKCFCM